MRVRPRVLSAWTAWTTAASAFSLSPARASETTPPPTPEQIEAAVKADAMGPSGEARQPTPPESQEEAPPPLPRKKGFVLESSIGALAFLGRFRQVAPTAPWFHVLFGYEPIELGPARLLAFAEGELALTDTSVAQDASKSRAFPIFGFGAGARFTFMLGDRVGVYAQGSLGAMKADVPNNAFTFLGYRDAEALGISLAGRVGVEWYQIDRHFALGLAVGIRDAKGFAKSGPTSDTPLMLDASAALRYTF